MTVRRRPRSSMENPVVPGWKVDRSARDKVRGAAAVAGISQSHLVQLLIERMELSEQGNPEWLPPHESDGELPIDSR